MLETHTYDWKLTVTFDHPDKQEYWADGNDLDYALQLTREAKQQWEHDDEASSLMQGIGFESDEPLWNVNEDHTEVVFTAEVIDCLVDLINSVCMRTIPKTMVLERIIE